MKRIASSRFTDLSAVENIARTFGASDPEIYENRSDDSDEYRGKTIPPHSVAIWVDLDARTRDYLQKGVRANAPPGLVVEVHPKEEDVAYVASDGAERRAETIKMENVSSVFGGGETPQRAAESREEDPVESAKNAYVEGEITILELEDQLEDALDPDPIAVA